MFRHSERGPLDTQFVHARLFSSVVQCATDTVRNVEMRHRSAFCPATKHAGLSCRLPRKGVQNAGRSSTTISAAAAKLANRFFGESLESSKREDQLSHDAARDGADQD